MKHSDSALIHRHWEAIILRSARSYQACKEGEDPFSLQDDKSTVNITVGPEASQRDREEGRC